MKRKRLKYWIAAALLLVVVLALALRNGGLLVEAGLISRGPLEVIVEGRGKAQVRDRFVVATPVTGHLQRVTLRAGDEVKLGGVLAWVSPVVPLPLDARARAEAETRLQAALSTAAEAHAAVDRAKIAHSYARKELTRAKELFSSGSSAPQALESAEFAEAARTREVKAAELAVRTATIGVGTARAMLRRFDAGTDRGRRIPLTSPTAGKVLRVLQEHEGPVQAGTPIIEVGDPTKLEVVVDLLTTEAVRVQPGMAVSLEQWGGAAAISGRVRLVEPAGFTKISALGVEEQRVNVIIDPPDETAGTTAPVSASWSALSDGYRVETRIVVWSQSDVLRVPSSSLFRAKDGWAVFAIERGRAVEKPVTLGERGQRQAQITGGLDEHARVILYPSDKVSDGTRVSTDK